MTGWIFQTEDMWSDTEAAIIESMRARALEAGKAGSMNAGWMDAMSRVEGSLVRVITWAKIDGGEVAMVFRIPRWCAIGVRVDA